MPCGGRLRQDPEGRQLVVVENTGFPLEASLQQQADLSNVLSHFVFPSHVQQHHPLVRVGENFTIQLDIGKMLDGASPLFGVRLTQVKGGSVLGLSISHLLAGATSLT